MAAVLGEDGRRVFGSLDEAGRARTQPVLLEDGRRVLVSPTAAEAWLKMDSPSTTWAKGNAPTTAWAKQT